MFGYKLGGGGTAAVLAFSLHRGCYSHVEHNQLVSFRGMILLLGVFFRRWRRHNNLTQTTISLCCGLYR